MVHHYQEQARECFSRRDVLRGVAGVLLMLGLEGCTQSLSFRSTPTPIPTTRPQGSVLYSYRGHRSRVTTVAWSPNGTYIASGSLDKTVHVWAVNPSNSLRPFIYRGHTDGVQSVAWSPDGSRVASGSLDKTVQVWNALMGEQRSLYEGHTDSVMTVAWSPHGHTLASGSADGTVRVWDVASGKQQYVYRGHTASVNSLVWSPNSRYIASGASDKTVHIIDATSGKQFYIYHGHTSTISSVSWSPDGMFIASGSWDRTVQVWHAFTGAVLYTYRGYNIQAARYDPSKGVLPDLILAVAWSHHGKRIAATTQVYCGDSCGIVLEWDAYTQQHFSFNIDLPIFALAWSPDDTRLVSSIEITTQDSSITEKDGPYVQITQA